MIRTGFMRTHHPVSTLIRHVTRSPWSHEFLFLDEEWVLDSTFPGGVRARRLTEVLAKASKWTTREWSVPNEAAAYAWALDQRGKPYDFWGALGLGLQRDWDHPERLWCSEVIEGTLRAGGRPRFVNDVRRITPQLSWMVAA